MPELGSRPTLGDIQQYVKRLETERGFDGDSTLQKCLLLGEELGELYKAVRRTEQIKTDGHSASTTVAEELADILVVLCTIANRRGIDLEAAFREKEEVNKKREWS